MAKETDNAHAIAGAVVVNPFDYLTQLQKHAYESSAAPDRWLPWNYQHTLQKTGAP